MAMEPTMTPHADRTASVHWFGALMLYGIMCEVYSVEYARHSRQATQRLTADLLNTCYMQLQVHGVN